MRISIVIPTRERGVYLSSCLDSCIAINDANIEIVVSDNASSDGTREIVEAKSDSRIIYTNTGRRVSMRANYENALKATTGEYLIFIGDDDAVLANGIKSLRCIIDQWSPDAIGWRLVHYNWPSEDGSRLGRLDIPLKAIYGELRKKDPALLFNKFCQAKVRSYKDGANLYHGCVSRKVIEKARGKDGAYFHGFSPDVYVSIANLPHMENFLWLRHPITLGGEGDRSIGRSILARKPVNQLSKSNSDMFIDESNQDSFAGDLDAKVRSVDPQMHAALHMINKLCLSSPYMIDDEAWMRRALHDFRNLQDVHQDESAYLYGKYLESIGLTEKYELLRRIVKPLKNHHNNSNATRKLFSISVTSNRIPTVADAALEIDRILGAYCPNNISTSQISFNRLGNLFSAWRRAGT